MPEVMPLKRIMLVFVLAVLMLAVFAPAVVAKPSTTGKVTDKEIGKPDKDTGNADKVTGNADKEDKGKPEDNGKAKQVSTAEGNETQLQKANKGEEKINQGKLISTVTKVRQEQFKLTKEELKAMGYHGSMSEFATQFNTAMNGVKWQIRERMQNESNFTRDVVKNMMTRELAQIREQLMANITVSDEELVDDVGNFTDNETAEAIEGEVPYMSEEFKEKLDLVIEYGTEEEQEELAEQLEEFAEEEEEVEPLEVNIEEVREQLEEGEELDLEALPEEEPTEEAPEEDSGEEAPEGEEEPVDEGTGEELPLAPEGEEEPPAEEPVEEPVADEEPQEPVEEPTPEANETQEQA